MHSGVCPRRVLFVQFAAFSLPPMHMGSRFLEMWSSRRLRIHRIKAAQRRKPSRRSVRSHSSLITANEVFNSIQDRSERSFNFFTTSANGTDSNWNSELSTSKGGTRSSGTSDRPDSTRGVPSRRPIQTKSHLIDRLSRASMCYSRRLVRNPPRQLFLPIPVSRTRGCDRSSTSRATIRILVPWLRRVANSDANDGTACPLSDESEQGNRRGEGRFLYFPRQPAYDGVPSGIAYRISRGR